MLTDDDLTRQLRAAFEEDTRAMTYDGAVPRVRTRPAWAAPGWVALPAAGAVAAAVLVLGSTGDATSPATPDAAPGPTTSAPSATPSGEDTVTETFTLAGMTFTYERGADEDQPAAGQHEGPGAHEASSSAQNTPGPPHERERAPTVTCGVPTCCAATAGRTA